MSVSLRGQVYTKWYTLEFGSFSVKNILYVLFVFCRGLSVSIYAKIRPLELTELTESNADERTGQIPIIIYGRVITICNG